MIDLGCMGSMFKILLLSLLFSTSAIAAQDRMFLVIYDGKEVAGSIGPLAGTLEMCEVEKQKYDDDKKRFLLDGVTVDGVKADPLLIAKVRQMSFSCELRTKRPTIGEQRK